jgi:hypothetical protein
MEEDLPAQIALSRPSDNRLRVGIYVASTGQVNIQGAMITAGKLASAAPVDGSIVAVMRQDKTWLILGVIT